MAVVNRFKYLFYEELNVLRHQRLFKVPQKESQVAITVLLHKPDVLFRHDDIYKFDDVWVFKFIEN